MKGDDLLIIGNGAVASAIAFEAKATNAFQRVTILGAAQRPGCASRAAGIMLNCFAEVDRATLKNPFARKKLDVSFAALGRWPSWLERVREAAGRKGPSIKDGTIVLNNARADRMDDDNFQAILEALSAYGERFEEVDPNAIPGYAPAPRFRALRAVHIPREGSIDSHAMLALLDDALTQLKVARLDQPVIAIEPAGNRVRVVLADGRILEAANTVLAAGAFSWDLLEDLPELQARVPRVFYGTGNGVRFSIQRQFGDRTRLPDVVLRTPNRGNACGVHLVPYDDDHGYVGASNHVSTIAETNPRIQTLHGILGAAMREVHRGLGMAQIAPVLGHRPTSADTYPLLGPTSIEGLWLATGTKRDGFHQSPLIAEALVKAMNGDQRLLEPAFAPERELITTMTREEGIAAAVAHRMSGGMQHDLDLAGAEWEDRMMRALHSEVTAIYDRLELTRGVAPELLNMVQHGHIPARAYQGSAQAQNSAEAFAAANR